MFQDRRAIRLAGSGRVGAFATKSSCCCCPSQLQRPLALRTTRQLTKCHTSLNLSQSVAFCCQAVVVKGCKRINNLKAIELLKVTSPEGHDGAISPDYSKSSKLSLSPLRIAVGWTRCTMRHRMPPPSKHVGPQTGSVILLQSTSCCSHVSSILWRSILWIGNINKYPM